MTVTDANGNPVKAKLKMGSDGEEVWWVTMPDSAINIDVVFEAVETDAPAPATEEPAKTAKTDKTAPAAKTAADKKLKNKKVTVYEKVVGKLKKVCTSKVDSKGNISFEADHLGKYIVAVK